MVLPSSLKTVSDLFIGERRTSLVDAFTRKITPLFEGSTFKCWLSNKWISIYLFYLLKLYSTSAEGL